MKNVLLLYLFVLLSLNCHSQVNQISLVINQGLPSLDLKHKIETNTSRFLRNLNEAFRKKSTSLVFDDKYISKKAQEAVQELWEGRHFCFPENKISENLLQKGNLFQVRNIPCNIGETEKSDKVDVVLEFLPDGRIDDFYFGLEAHDYKSILYGASSVADQSRREIIKNFLENLRTAYIKKDTNYIRKLYSDKALIIVGKALEAKNVSTDQFKKSLSSNQYAYQVFTKNEYIKRLQAVFEKSSYIKLGFKQIQVTIHKKYPNFYGIKLQQTWVSSNYQDDGLLFLLVQFKGNEDPLIWVRTWQDVRDTPPGNEFDLHNFTISEGERIQ